jgi:hypothetical protein
MVRPFMFQQRRQNIRNGPAAAVGLNSVVVAIIIISIQQLYLLRYTRHTDQLRRQQPTSYQQQQHTKFKLRLCFSLRHSYVNSQVSDTDHPDAAPLV